MCMADRRAVRRAALIAASNSAASPVPSRRGPWPIDSTNPEFGNVAQHAGGGSALAGGHAVHDRGRGEEGQPEAGEPASAVAVTSLRVPRVRPGSNPAASAMMTRVSTRGAA